MAKCRVREIARSQGVTQLELAYRSGLALSTIQRLWQNRTVEEMKHSTLSAAANALGVSVDDLFVDDETSSERATLRGNRSSLEPVAA